MPRSRQNEPPDRTGEVIADRFIIESSIARGGMGCVYLASQVNLQRKAAIKILPPHPDHDQEFRERFLLEASTCARLSHPHIVTVYDYGQTTSGELYMAMEYVQGEPLSKAIQASGRLSVERTCDIAIQACRALRVAHRVGIVHRDLKPSNLMVGWSEDNNSDFVKVLDFGLAKRFNKDTEQAAVTESGIWLGSLHYMAPEQIRCESVDPRTDVYSLGVLMYHMVSGRVPFPGAKVLDVLQKHLGEKPPRLRDIMPAGSAAPELEVIIQR
ncbi:MAG: serine/threonine-protein kinase, partial [Myxococcota bacterium]